jgi:lipopolysaccharide export system permease protein
MSAEPPRKPRPRIFVAPFGRHSRYLLSLYLRHVLIVVSVLLAIALTIDLWPQFQDVAARGSGSLGAVWSVVRFSALRTPGLIAPLLPFATFIGVVWTEVAHTQSGERMLVWNSGRSPLQCLAPVVLAGVILGGADFLMDGFLGPASMNIQMTERLGRDGVRLDRGKLSEPAWMTAGGGILKAEIQYGPPPVLRNVMFFERDNAGRLTEVDVAPVAYWQEDKGHWVMPQGKYWHAKGSGDVTRTVLFGRQRAQTLLPFEGKTIRLDVDPLWFTWYDLQPQYIPLPALAQLAASDKAPDARGQYETRLHIVLAELVLPGLMAMLASSLAMLLLAYGTTAPAVIAIVFSGYIAHFGIKACLIMGQNGYMNPLIAGWLVPALLVIVIAGVFAVGEMQKKKSSPVSAG